jgi:hypothetical protein
MVQTPLLLAFVLGLTLAAVAAGWALGRSRADSEPVVTVTEPLADNDLELRVFRLEQKIELLPQTWEGFRDGALKAEQRSRHQARVAARRAEQELEGVEEPGSVPRGDESAGGDQRMLALRNGMGFSPPPDPENELLKLVARIKGYG